MKLLDEKGIGTVWSICKEKFALVGHTHNYAGSGSPGGSANSAIGVVDYNQTGKTIQIGFSGAGITGDQIKYIAGYTDGSGNVNAKIKDVSKDALKSWLGLGSLAYSSSSIPTKLSQLTNDEGFVTGSDLSSYSQKSETVKKIYTYTTNDGSQRIGIVNANGEQSYQNLVNVTPSNDGCMSKKDKVKLDGIASGANNYTLPTASVSTLGGIKTGYNGNLAGYRFPIELDDEDNACADIEGLFTLNGNLRSIHLSNEVTKTVYDANGITRKNTNDEVRATISFPEKSGTLAITSDIPDVSSLCKFNFVNSISDCVNGRINFLFKNSNEYVDLSFLSNLEEGTILLIYSPFVDFQITDKGSVWYYNGRSVASEDTAYIGNAKLVLAFFNDTYVYVCTFSYN